MKTLVATLALAAIALAAAACGTTNAGEPGGPAASPVPADPSAPVVVAQDMRFTTEDVVVEAGAPVALTFENKDSAPHNVAIYIDSSASEVVFRGEIFSSGSQVYELPALAPGSYFFRCDVHPDMTGTIVAE